MPKSIEKEGSGLAYVEQRRLVTFTHNYKGVKKAVSVWLEPSLDSSCNGMIEVYDDDSDDSDGDCLGTMVGNYIENGKSRNFYTVLLDNETREQGISRVPRIVGSTIAQLVSRGLITEWYSSYAFWLSSEARYMYDHFLRGSAGLSIQEPTEEFPAYIVTV